MRQRNSHSSEQNFWVSYADLMAGLLFIFLLIIGAIVVKYLYAQSDLYALKTNLEEQKRILQISEEALEQKKRDVATVTDQLIAAKQANLELTLTQAALEKELATLKNDANITETALLAARALLAKEASEKEASQTQLRLSTEELESLKALLLDVESERDATKGELVAYQSQVTEQANMLSLKEAQVTQLSKALLDKTLAHQALLEDLNITQTRIKNLTGIRLKVIQRLKEKMGTKIAIDPKSGAIVLPASVLFDVGSHELKPDAKQRLKEALKPYFGVLLGDKEIRDNLDRILIEGHTDSDGSYMYNLDLSQKRALSVMAYLYSWDEKQNPLLQRYVSAIGRSYSDPILKNGAEDKEASRRIEIKFSLSNQKAIAEIESFLKR